MMGFWRVEDSHPRKSARRNDLDDQAIQIDSPVGGMDRPRRGYSFYRRAGCGLGSNFEHLSIFFRGVCRVAGQVDNCP